MMVGWEFTGLVGFPGLVDSLDWLVQGPVGSVTCQFTDWLNEGGPTRNYNWNWYPCGPRLLQR